MQAENEASQYLDQTTVLLNQFQASLRASGVPEGLSPGQRHALARAEAALAIYVSFFYPTDPIRRRQDP